MTLEQQAILQLLREVIIPSAAIAIPSGVDWRKFIQSASEQGVLGICFDSIEKLPAEARHDMDSLMEWLGRVSYMEQLYEAHREAIGALADFYQQYGIRMMLMKGYGLSLDYPVPEHRPTGDIDIYLFGEKDRADRLVHDKLKTRVDEEYHKHSHFSFRGATVENHEKFIDDINHKSNVRFEQILMEMLREDRLGHSPISNCYLPSPTWNALFLLRHAGEHFASSAITLRHILDLGTFFSAHHAEIEWKTALCVYREENMMPFYNAIATICVRDLGFGPDCFSGYQDCPALADRVLEDVFLKRKALPQSMAGIDTLGKKIRYGIQKSIRWYQNRWKYKMVYRESLLDSFFTLALNRIKHS